MFLYRMLLMCPRKYAEILFSLGPIHSRASSQTASQIWKIYTYVEFPL